MTRHWRRISDGQVVDGWVTSKARPVLDCCLDLPLDEALAVADSALRDGLDLDEVVAVGRSLPPRVRRRLATTFGHANRKADNLFESVLRALCIEVGPQVVTQRVIRGEGFYAKVDLAVVDLKIAIEAEGFEHHGTRAGLLRDCVRYTGLAARGWVVLRFTWHQVRYEQDHVRQVLRDTIAVRRAQLTSPSTASKAREPRP